MAERELIDAPPHRELDRPLLAARGHPACFDSREQYLTWARLADIVSPATADAIHTRGVCADCTFGYKARMVREGRCARAREKLLAPVE